MEQQTPTQFQALRLLYISLVSGIIAFTIVAIYLVSQKKMEPVIPQDMRQIVSISIVIAAGLFVLLAFYLFRRRIQSLAGLDTKTKMEKYRAASIIRWAMVELPLMISLIAYLLSSDQLYLLLAAVLLGIFLSVRPSKTTISRHLQINEEELETL